MQIEQVSPGFGEKYLLQTEKFAEEIKNYKRYITQMLKAYSNTTQAENFAEDIVKFSTEIAKVSCPRWFCKKFKVRGSFLRCSLSSRQTKCTIGANLSQTKLDPTLHSCTLNNWHKVDGKYNTILISRSSYSMVNSRTQQATTSIFINYSLFK